MMSSKSENMAENLYSQLDALRRRDNTKSHKTRARYYEAAKHFCRFSAENFGLQKFKNMNAKHFRAFAEYLKEEKSPATAQTELAGVRHFYALSGGTNKLPENKDLFLTKRSTGQINFAWLPHEIKAAIQLAEEMKRFDVRDAIQISWRFGLRIFEICKLRVEDVKKALESEELYVKGKGARERWIRLETPEQWELVRRLYNEAKRRNLQDGDFLISRSVKYGTMREKASLENWLTNHRHRFTDPNRQSYRQPGCKPFSAELRWHGLRYRFAQEYNQRLSDAKDPRREQKLTEALGHGRVSVLKTYLA